MNKSEIQSEVFFVLQNRHEKDKFFCGRTQSHKSTSFKQINKYKSHKMALRTLSNLGLSLEDWQIVEIKIVDKEEINMSGSRSQPSPNDKGNQNEPRPDDPVKREPSPNDKGNQNEPRPDDPGRYRRR